MITNGVIKAFVPSSFRKLTALSDTEEQNFCSLSKLQRELNENAKLVDTSLGSGKHGFLVLTIGADKYKDETSKEWKDPENPGTVPTIKEDATPAIVQLKTQNHHAQSIEWRNFVDVERELRKAVIKAVPETYISELADDTNGFSDVTTYNILKHLWKTYGDVNDKMKQANLAKLDEPWDPKDPITTLWTNVANAVKFANKTKEPLADGFVSRKIKKLLTDSGLFTEDLRQWHKETDQLLKNMKKFFTAANKHRLETATTASEGYAGVAGKTQQSVKVKTATSKACCWTHGFNTSHSSMECHTQA